VASGQASLADGTWHAILWQGAHKRDLGTLGGPNSTVYFGGPNAAGQVAGFAETDIPDPNGEDFCGFAAQAVPSSGTCLGFLWQYDWMIPLLTLGGYNSAANSINDRGEVAGNAETATKDSTCPPYDPAQGQFQVLQEKPVIWKDGDIKETPHFRWRPGRNCHGDQ